MATIVTGEQYMVIDGKLHEIKRQLRQKGGYPHDPEQLDRALQAIVDGRFEIVAKPTFPSLEVAADLILSRYKIVADVAPTLKSGADLEAVPLLEPRDGCIVSGETMRSRAKAKKANLGLADLRVALADQAKITEGARPYRLIFSGTVLRSPLGILYVAYLAWRDGGWLPDLGRVADIWDDGHRLARSKSA